MQRFGDFFPENPAEPRRAARDDGPAHGSHAGDAQLDDARAAGAAAGPRRAAARRHGPALAGRPARRAPARPVPADGLGAPVRLRGQDPLGFAEAAQLMQQLGDIDQLENLLRGATNPGALAEVDIDRARDLLGDDSARSLERLRGARQDAGAGGPDREQGRPVRADAEGHPQDRGERALRSLRQARQGQDGQARARAQRRRARALVRVEALRVRRSLQPRHPPHDPQRDTAHGRGHSGRLLRRHAGPARRAWRRSSSTTSTPRSPRSSGRASTGLLGGHPPAGRAARLGVAADLHPTTTALGRVPGPRHADQQPQRRRRSRHRRCDATGMAVFMVELGWFSHRVFWHMVVRRRVRRATRASS